MPYGFAFIAIWAIIYPVVVYSWLERIKNHLSYTNHLKLYGVFYIGMNDNSYYWEIVVVNIRKILLILCAAFLNGQKQGIRVSSAILKISRDLSASSFSISRDSSPTTRNLSWTRDTMR
jgi:hypothetical protein